MMVIGQGISGSQDGKKGIRDGKLHCIDYCTICGQICYLYYVREMYVLSHMQARLQVRRAIAGQLSKKEH